MYDRVSNNRSCWHRVSSPSIHTFSFCVRLIFVWECLVAYSRSRGVPEDRINGSLRSPIVQLFLQLSTLSFFPFLDSLEELQKPRESWKTLDTLLGRPSSHFKGSLTCHNAWAGVSVRQVPKDRIDGSRRSPIVRLFKSSAHSAGPRLRINQQTNNVLFFIDIIQYFWFSTLRINQQTNNVLFVH